MHAHPNQLESHCPPRWRSTLFGKALGSALFGVLCAFAQAQDPAIDRLVSADATRLLRHQDPLVRGEAALVAASSHDRDVLAQVLALANDSHAGCRQRALLALGVFGSPAAVNALDNCLRDGNRSDADAVVAAFALGMAPEEAASGVVTRVLASVMQGSWKRQRDLLVALLLGISLQTERHDGAALRQLLDNESNRDPEVRGLLLTLLLPVDPTLRGAALDRVLDRGEPAERTAVLRWLGTCDEGIDSELLPHLERIASRGSTAGDRAGALQALARVHHVHAVELATKALRSNEPQEAPAGLATLLELGGARMRAPLEQRLLEERDPACLAALLQHYQAPLSTALADHCAKLATDPAASWSARASATVTLAHHRPERAEPLLRDAFRKTTARSTLLPLALALARAAEPAPLSRLLEPGTRLTDDPTRWIALVRAGHAEARRVLLQQLTARDASASNLATSLSVWRRAEVLRAPHLHGTTLPAALRELLGE